MIGNKNALQYTYLNLNQDLEKFLKEAYLQFNRSQYLESDPILFLHRYNDPYDQEAVGLLSALLAYGNVKQIKKSIEQALQRIHSGFRSPSEFVRALQNESGRKEARLLFRGFYHRFNQGKDVALLFEVLSRSWVENRSLGAHFMKYHLPEHQDIEIGLTKLIADLKKWGGKKASAGFRYLLTSPEDGSCCKRWCMFLRWMGRQDEVDPGLWTEAGKLRSTFPQGRYLRSDQLVMPLDTHTGKISRYFALTQRRSTDWLAAQEVTGELKKLNRNDPVSYDFAMSRLGILGLL